MIRFIGFLMASFFITSCATVGLSKVSTWAQEELVSIELHCQQEGLACKTNLVDIVLVKEDLFLVLFSIKTIGFTIPGYALVNHHTEQVLFFFLDLPSQSNNEPGEDKLNVSVDFLSDH